MSMVAGWSTVSLSAENFFSSCVDSGLFVFWALIGVLAVIVRLFGVA